MEIEDGEWYDYIEYYFNPSRGLYDSHEAIKKRRVITIEACNPLAKLICY